MLKIDSKYIIVINGRHNMLEMNRNKYATIYGQTFPEKVLVKIACPEFINPGSTIGLRVMSETTVQITENHMQRCEVGNAFTFSVDSLKEV